MKQSMFTSRMGTRKEAEQGQLQPGCEPNGTGPQSQGAFYTARRVAPTEFHLSDKALQNKPGPVRTLCTREPTPPWHPGKDGLALPD